MALAFVLHIGLQICFTALLEINNSCSWSYLFIYFINYNLFLAYVLFLFPLLILMIRAVANIHDSASVFASYREVHPPLLIHSLCSCEHWNFFLFFFFFWSSWTERHHAPILKRYCTVGRAVSREKKTTL